MQDEDRQTIVLTEGDVSQPLRCLHIDKDALKVVEDHLIRRLGELFSLSGSPDVSIEIKDGVGTEKVSRIEHFLPARFSDSTHCIELVAEHREGRGKGKGSVRVKIRFDTSSFFSGMQARVTGRASREVAMGLLDGIGRVLAPYETWYGFFNPRLEVLLGLWLATAILYVTYFLFSSVPSVQVISIVLALISTAYLLIRQTFPRLTFDTPAEERRRGLRKWWLGGIMSFVVFGVLFTLARRHLLGF